MVNKLLDLRGLSIDGIGIVTETTILGFLEPVNHGGPRVRITANSLRNHIQKHYGLAATIDHYNARMEAEWQEFVASERARHQIQARAD